MRASHLRPTTRRMMRTSGPQSRKTSGCHGSIGTENLALRGSKMSKIEKVAEWLFLFHRRKARFYDMEWNELSDWAKSEWIGEAKELMALGGSDE